MKIILDKTAPALYNYAMIKHWTTDEEARLLELKQKGVRLADIAKHLNRSPEAVKTRSKRLAAQNGVISKSGNFSWTDAEVGTLYTDLDYDELAAALGKSRRAIMSKCEKLGISKRFPGTNKSPGTMNVHEPATLYLVDFGEYKKVGVTQVSLHERFKHEKFFRVLDVVEMDVKSCLETEGEILRNMREYKVVGDLHRGSLECFNYDCALLSDLI